MGHAKRALERQADEGFLLEDDWTPVCSECIGDAALRVFTARAGPIERCGFCGGSDRNGMRLGDLFSYMAGCLDAEYLNTLIHFTPDPTAWGLVHFDSGELLYELGEPLAHDGLRESFVEAFSNDWCLQEPFRLPPHERLGHGWDAFARYVTEEARYLFLRTGRSSRPADPELVEPADMLEELRVSIVNSGLVQRLPAGTGLLRARQHDPDQVLATSAELGSPPRSKAAANRMSPVGIPMFYGGQELETALAELRLETYPRRATVAMWSTARELAYLDLVDVDVPSIFDMTARGRRPWRQFLRRFAAEAAQPADSAGITYVPTQIVTEFIRHELLDVDGTQVRGIRFSSAARAGGVSWVLFVGAGGCVEAAPGWQDNQSHWLGLEPGSIRRFEPSWREVDS